MRMYIFKIILLFISFNAYSFELPNSRLTPGHVDHERTKDILCIPKFTSGKDDDGTNIRHVPVKVRNAVFIEYGISEENRSKYVIDHLVSLSNGGLNSFTNLWPQPKSDSRMKDVLENKLHRMVCSGQLTVEEAQNALRINWVSSYAKYVKDLDFSED